MGTITKRKEGDNTYYAYQETYRVKISSQDSGKIRGSGKSKVKTRSVYLGTADKILQCVQESREQTKKLKKWKCACCSFWSEASNKVKAVCQTCGEEFVDR